MEYGIWCSGKRENVKMDKKKKTRKSNKDGKGTILKFKELRVGAIIIIM